MVIKRFERVVMAKESIKKIIKAQVDAHYEIEGYEALKGIHDGMYNEQIAEYLYHRDISKPLEG